MIRRRLFTVASVLSLLLCVATVVLWVKSYHAPMMCGVPTVPGWRMVVNAGRTWADDEPLWRDVRRDLHKRVRAFETMKEAQLQGLQKGRYRVELEVNRRWLPVEYLSAYKQIQWADESHLYRVEARLRRELATNSPITFHHAPKLSRITAVSAFLPTIWLFLLLVNRKAMGHCAVCGYNLTGNTSGICPECGTAVRQKDTA